MHPRCQGLSSQVERVSAELAEARAEAAETERELADEEQKFNDLALRVEEAASGRAALVQELAIWAQQLREEREGIERLRLASAELPAAAAGGLGEQSPLKQQTGVLLPLGAQLRPWW